MEETLGKRISAHRKTLGLTQDALAERLGITAQAVSKWENDQSCPDITMLPRLAEIFHCTTDELLGLAANEPHIIDAIPSEEVSEEPKPRKREIHWSALASPGSAFGFWIFLTGVVSLIDAIIPYPCDLADIALSCGIFVFGLFSLFRRFSLLRLGCTLAGGAFVLNLLFYPGIVDMDWRVPLCGGLALFGLDLLLDSLLGRTHPVPKGHLAPSCMRNNFSCEGDAFDCTTWFGEDRHLLTMPQLTRGQAEVNFGSLTLDLTGCQAFSENCQLELHSSFGEMTVLVPKWCRAEVHVQTAFAVCDTFGQPAPDASAKFYVNGRTSFGHIVFQYL